MGVQADGKAVGDGHVEVAAGKVRSAQKSLERAQKSWDALKAGWAALESAEDTLLQLESAQEGREKDRARTESAREKASQRAESIRDAAANSVAALVEVGIAYVDAFRVNKDQPLSATALKTVHQAAKAKFRQMSSAWTRAKQLQEAWAKVSHFRLRTAKKVSAAVVAAAEADDWLEAVEGEHEEALAAEERERSSRLACDQALLEAERQQGTAEVENVGQKCRRSECQAAISSARTKLRPAKVAEKEASTGRAALLSHYSKADKGQIKVELEATASSAKEALSAVRALKAEEYDANQVEDAYQAKKKQRTDANADNID